MSYVYLRNVSYYKGNIHIIHFYTDNIDNHIILGHKANYYL